MRIGVLGGTFDPIHIGHLIVAEQMRAERNLDRVLFIPTRTPPHKLGRHLQSGEHRLEMVRLAAAGRSAFEPSDIELLRDGPSYSVDTIAELKETLGGEHRFFFIIGADTLPVLPTWRRPADLVDSVDFLTATRPGYPLDCWSDLKLTFSDEQIARLKKGCVETIPVGISSSDIRQRLRDGRTIRYLVPKPVEDHIYKHGLYGALKEKRT